MHDCYNRSKGLKERSGEIFMLNMNNYWIFNYYVDIILYCKSYGKLIEDVPSIIRTSCPTYKAIESQLSRRCKVQPQKEPRLYLKLYQ